MAIKHCHLTSKGTDGVHIVGEQQVGRPLGHFIRGPATLQPTKYPSPI